jgi:RNA polymerase sigma-70 factor (ECF subfamily)
VTAFREFVEQNATRINRTACAIVGNREDADEIAQSVFVKAWFSAGSRDERGSSQTWIYRLVVNECYWFLRTKPLKAANDDGFARTHLRRDLLNTALDRIPEEDRYMLLLRELEGYSVQELSEATGLDESTIGRKLFAARQRLAKKLGRQAQ